MSRIRTSILVLVVLFAPAGAVAQSWPTAQPIKAIITFSAGSASDVIARAVFDQVSTQIGQTIVVENRVGAGGTLGVQEGPQSPTRLMSVHVIHKICRQVLRDHNFRGRMQSDPAAAIADYDLTSEERHALLAGDVATLHHMGVNDFMMGYLARFGSCGLSVPIFNEKIRSVPHCSGKT